MMLFPYSVVQKLSAPQEFAGQRSARATDRGKKFSNYRHIPSLREYVLITPTEPLIEVFTRQPSDEWLMRVYEGLEAQVRLDSLDLTLPLASFYAKTPVLGVPLEEV